MKKIKLNNLSPYVIFTSVSLIGIILFFVMAVLKGSVLFDWVVMESNGKKCFMDYFLHVFATSYHHDIYKSINVYIGARGVFPPLSYVFYGLLYRMNATNTVPGSYPELMNSEYSLMIFLFYSVIVVLIVLYAFTLWKRQSHFKCAFICILCSVPFFAGALERGNSALLVFALLLIALYCKDSDSKVEREIALILIAICAGLKIYPAVMGFLYVKEKRQKEALRLLGYGLIFFFVPFMFFGGLDGFLVWFANVQSMFDGNGAIGRIEYISGLMQVFSYYLTGERNEFISSLIALLFVLFMFIMFFESKDKYRTVFYLCALMTFYPGYAYRYTLLYVAIPLVMYLMEKGDDVNCDALTKIEMIVYGCVFSIPTVFGILTNFKLKTSLGANCTCVELWTYAFAYLLLFLVVVHDLWELYKNKKLLKNQDEVAINS